MAWFAIAHIPKFESLSRYGLIYLATPYTLHPEGKNEAYLEASSILARIQMHGLPVYSPITHWHDAATTQFMNDVEDKDWLGINRPIMNVCGAMIVPDLDGWDKSAGIAEEIVEFRESRKPVYLIDRILLDVVKRL